MIQGVVISLVAKHRVKLKMDDLKHQVMINQFVLAAGCLSHEAKTYLKSSHWQFEAALSLYFGESGIPNQQCHHPNRPPANTPATPPGFSEALLSFAKMDSGEGNPFQQSNGQAGAQKCKLVRPDPNSASKKASVFTQAHNNNRS